MASFIADNANDLCTMVAGCLAPWLSTARVVPVWNRNMVMVHAYRQVFTIYTDGKVYRYLPVGERRSNEDSAYLGHGEDAQTASDIIGRYLECYVAGLKALEGKGE